MVPGSCVYRALDTALSAPETSPTYLVRASPGRPLPPPRRNPDGGTNMARGFIWGLAALALCTPPAWADTLALTLTGGQGVPFASDVMAGWRFRTNLDVTVNGLG